jgi:hypothetical protein
MLLKATQPAWPLAARAQQPAMPVIGLLSGSSPEASRRPMAAFQRALADSGFIEGHSVTIDYRWAGGRFDLLPAMAADGHPLWCTESCDPILHCAQHRSRGGLHPFQSTATGVIRLRSVSSFR